jgi:hypothetical protein
MATINLAHETFIREMILHGDRLKAYKAAYPNCSEKTAIVNACRLMARPGIAGRIRQAVCTAQRKAEAELEEYLAGEVMSMAHQRHLLYQIATGKLTTTKTVVRYNKVINCQHRPGHTEMLAAIRLDWKLSQGWKRDVDDASDET